MSQPRMRKVPVAAACNGSRPRPAVINKAPGDPGPCTRSQKQQHEKRSKNNIPKSIRYDLENALVGLCDVWFEDIKPHLVRNKIKLHVHGGPAPAGGDHRRLPPGAPGCSHLDPGAASDHCPRPAAICAGCCSTPPTVSRAPSLRLPMRQAHSRSRLLLPSPPFPLSPPLNLNSKDGRKRKHRSQRHSRFSKAPSPQATWRVPRICRTYTALSPPATPKPILRKMQIVTQSKQHRDNVMVEMKNKSTQTELVSNHIQCSMQQRRMSPSVFGCCTATTAFFPSKCEKNTNPSIKNSVHQSRISKEPLYSKELVNIIGEKNDKRLKLLYKSPIREEYSSILNLVQSPKDCPTEAGIRKKRPWR